VAGFSFVKSSKLAGVGLLNCVHSADQRGKFIKTLTTSSQFPTEANIHIREEFLSFSNKNVLRGMHFQVPPSDHLKHVTVLNGSILDVVLDLRKTSPTFGKYEVFELKAQNPQVLVIPSGFAHGFLSLQDETLVSYRVDCAYDPAHDTGIHYNSFGFDWPTQNPVVSDRDKSFVNLENFKSPF
jgi:dTDP-4-dehydrorhamnose 3,5-epimerase